ncbi:hypothetical protein [Phocaeicola sp.]|uniref:hypothetical protein n=1 Tax=Phocaeicola sp. TaxID=2773926 RepID=UPI0023D27AC9|nr:hypothetical protein [Phocaeicola sp.]MDE5677450.1 hypothetical protein [Phocaeicola sp.]
MIFINISIVGCSKSPQQKQAIEQTNSEDIKFLKGKNINLDSIICDTKDINVIYLFNYYDCETCIHNGFTIVNQIDNQTQKGYVKVIESRCPEINSLQKRERYYEYIYSDKNDDIRKKLKYSPTPVLLLLDDSKKIIDALITTNLQQNEVNQFIHKCHNSFINHHSDK